MTIIARLFRAPLLIFGSEYAVQQATRAGRFVPYGGRSGAWSGGRYDGLRGHYYGRRVIACWEWDSHG